MPYSGEYWHRWKAKYPQKYKEAGLQWRRGPKYKAYLERTKRRRKEDPGFVEKERAKQRRYKAAHPDLGPQRRRKIRLETLSHYSGQTPPRCVCCGESGFWFLTLDHINGGGRSKENGRGGHVLYEWLRKRGYPLGFQTLCFNCNSAKGILGECPHKKGQVEVFPMEDRY